MSPTFAAGIGAAGQDVVVVGDGSHSSLRLSARLTVTEAGRVRHAVTSVLESLHVGGRAIVDLGEVTELDAAGLAAVTAPVFASRRRGCRVTVLPPEAPAARRFARMVGVLPIGVD